MSQFVSEPKLETYSIHGYTLQLRLESGVFCPSEQGLQFADFVSSHPNETVLDMGTGTGILGILAAKQGGIVDVCDSSGHAVDLAIRNAELNNVVLNGYVGEYFCTPRKKYDYIIANLPQEILPAAYANKIGALEKTISGGPKGNHHILKFLEQAPIYMNDESRILIAVGTMTDYITTLHKMRTIYRHALLGVMTSPAKDFVQENMSEYISMMENSDMGLFKKDGLLQSTILIYELRKK